MMGTLIAWKTGNELHLLNRTPSVEECFYYHVAQ